MSVTVTLSVLSPAIEAATVWRILLFSLADSPSGLLGQTVTLAVTMGVLCNPRGSILS